MARRSYQFGTRSTGEFKTARRHRSMEKPPKGKRKGVLAVIVFVEPKGKRVKA